MEEKTVHLVAKASYQAWRPLSGVVVREESEAKMASNRQKIIPFLRKFKKKESFNNFKISEFSKKKTKVFDRKLCFSQAFYSCKIIQSNFHLP